MKIFLVGMTGSGKSTLGKQLAEDLKYSFVDSDKWIEEREGKRVEEIFQENGELHFRKLETDFVKFANTLNNAVVATGAGLPCVNNNMEQINQMGITVWLDVDTNTITERLLSDPTPRPKLKEFGSIQEAVKFLFEQRKQFYQLAKLQIKNPTNESLLQTIQKF